MTEFEIILSAMFALVVAFASSRWIESLYKKFFAELSFPSEIERRGKLRKIILPVAVFCCVIYFIKLPVPQNFYSIVAAIFLLLVTVTDFEQQIIFDRMLLPFAILGIISTLHLNLSVMNHLLAAIFGCGFFLFLSLMSKGGIGGGDIKFVSALGLWFGTEKLFAIATHGMIFAGVGALILILFGRANRKDFFAYAPYFSVTAMYYI